MGEKNLLRSGSERLPPVSRISIIVAFCVWVSRWPVNQPGSRKEDGSLSSHRVENDGARIRRIISSSYVYPAIQGI